MRRGLFFGLTLCLGAFVFFSLSSQVAFSSQPITRSEIISRAQIWVDDHVPYTKDGPPYDLYMGYRQDCSGFVSFAWKLIYANGDPESKSTVTLDNISYKITKEQLKAGDVLNDNDSGNAGHVVIFHKWANSEQTQYWGYELAPSGTQYRTINYPYDSSPQDFVPRRYNNIQEVSPFDDEFSSTALDPKWHWIREDSTHWSLAASQGYLRVITQPKDLHQNTNNAPLLLQSLDPSSNDDFEIRTRVVVTPTANYHQGGLVIYGDDNNYVRVTYAYIDHLSFEFAKETGGNFQPIQVPAPSGVNNFYLRIVKIGMNYSGYYSQDGNNWILIGKQQNVNVSPSQIGLLAFNGYNCTPIEIPADFDYFVFKDISYQVFLPSVSK